MNRGGAENGRRTWGSAAALRCLSLSDLALTSAGEIFKRFDESELQQVRPPLLISFWPPPPAPPRSGYRGKQPLTCRTRSHGCEPPEELFTRNKRRA